MVCRAGRFDARVRGWRTVLNRHHRPTTELRHRDRHVENGYQIVCWIVEKNVPNAVFATEYRLALGPNQFRLMGRTGGRHQCEVDERSELWFGG